MRESRLHLQVLHDLLSQRTARSVLRSHPARCPRWRPSIGLEKLPLTSDAAGGKPTASRGPRRTVTWPEEDGQGGGGRHE